MHWILIAYLAALVVLSLFQGRLPDNIGLQKAWFFFSLAFFSKVVVTLFQVNNMRNPADLMCGQLWQEGLPYLFIGLSMVSLSKCFAQDR